MFGSGRTVGFVMLSSAIMVACSGTISSTAFFVLIPFSGSRNMMIGSLLLATPFMGLGAFLYWRGKKTLSELAIIQHQKRLLFMLKQQEYVRINDVGCALGKSPSYVQYLIHDLVAKGLFHGYLDRTEGLLFPRWSGSLRGLKKCPICAGKQEFTRKRTIDCQHCRAQIFL